MKVTTTKRQKVFLTVYGVGTRGELKYFSTPNAVLPHTYFTVPGAADANWDCNAIKSARLAGLNHATPSTFLKYLGVGVYDSSFLGNGIGGGNNALESPALSPEQQDDPALVEQHPVDGFECTATSSTSPWQSRRCMHVWQSPLQPSGRKWGGRGTMGRFPLVWMLTLPAELSLQQPGARADAASSPVANV
jgi:hypothetical protein